jgi:mannose-6-phosphate isomerase-like protein (cupin superfamily)
MIYLTLKYAVGGISSAMPTAAPSGQWKNEQKPWGHSELIFKNEGEGRVTTKILTVDPHSRLSLQKHKVRSEYWFVMNGNAEVDVGGGTVVLGPGETIRIPRGTAHRLGTNKGTRVLEVSMGDFDEADIIRLEDDYGRA